MPQKSWAVGEEVLAADFNTYLQNQVVPAFASTAQRDTQWAAPPEGALCTTIDTDTLWQRVGSNWWYTPGARIAAATPRTTDFGWTGTADSAAILTLTVAGVPSGRKIRLEASFMGANSATVNDRAYLKIKESTTVLTTCNLNFNANFQCNGGTFATTLTPSAGSHTYTLVAAGGSAGNFNLQCAPGGPLLLEAFDVGPT